MTFDEIVNEICERTNLTSDAAKSRVGRSVNVRYRRVTSAIGLQTSRFVQVSQVATPGQRVMTFYGIEKVIAVIDKSSGVDIALTEITPDEMHITPIRLEPPRKFAVIRLHTASVDIQLDGPATTPYVLYADGHTNVATLSGGQQPDFPESFHDILVYGAMVDEYLKQEKSELANAAQKEYEVRLSDLRMWIAKTAYKEIHQGRYSGKNFRWTRDPQTYWDS